MDYTISCFTWSFWDTFQIPHDQVNTQKSTKPILALKLSVSAIITPGGLPHSLHALLASGKEDQSGLQELSDPDFVHPHSVCKGSCLSP